MSEAAPRASRGPSVRCGFGWVLLIVMHRRSRPRRGSNASNASGESFVVAADGDAFAQATRDREPAASASEV